MSELINKYGYCIIPEGTVLFRSGDFNIENGVYFTLQHWIFNSLNPLKYKEVWVTKKDIEILFMVKNINEYSYPQSSISEIYKQYFQEELDDLSIKLDIEKRNQLIKRLQEDKLKGWFSTYENEFGSSFEICIFINEEDFNETFEQQSIIDIENINSLKNLKLYPSDLFFEKSKKIIKNNSFEKYEKAKKYFINQRIMKGFSQKNSEDYYFDLRIAFKI
jgi:hypothetical protein